MTYVLVVRPVRAGFAESATEGEREVVGRHFGYIKAGFEAGVVSYVGRCEDAAFGLVIFEAADGGAAEAWARGDPAVMAGVFSAEVRAFRVVMKQ